MQVHRWLMAHRTSQLLMYVPVYCLLINRYRKVAWLQWTQCLLIGTYLQVSQRYIVKAAPQMINILLIVARDTNKWATYIFNIYACWRVKAFISNPRWRSFIKVTHELLKTTFSSLSLERVYPEYLFNQIPLYPVRMESWHSGLSQFVQTATQCVYPVERRACFFL